MTHYILGDAEIRQLVANQLNSKGLVDPDGFFERMLLSAGAGEAVDDVLMWSEGWLNEWAEQLATFKGATLSRGFLPAK